MRGFLTSFKGIVMSTARTLQFPLPISSAVEQLYILGSSHGYGREDDSGIVRLFLPTSPNAVYETARQPVSSQTLGTSGSSQPNQKIGMIGLGAMGQGMAASLLRADYAVTGFDVYEPSIAKFLSTGGNAKGAKSPAEAVKGADVVLLMVQNASQVDDALFGSGNAIESLNEDATIILSSTVPPAYVRELENKLKSFGKGFSLVDAPVSGGVARAANGTLTVSCILILSDYVSNST